MAGTKFFIKNLSKTFSHYGSDVKAAHEMMTLSVRVHITWMIQYCRLVQIKRMSYNSLSWLVSLPLSLDASPWLRPDACGDNSSCVGSETEERVVRLLNVKVSLAVAVSSFCFSSS